LLLLLRLIYVYVVTLLRCCVVFVVGCVVGYVLLYVLRLRCTFAHVVVAVAPVTFALLRLRYVGFTVWFYPLFAGCCRLRCLLRLPLPRLPRLFALRCCTLPVCGYVAVVVTLPLPLLRWFTLLYVCVVGYVVVVVALFDLDCCYVDVCYRVTLLLYVAFTFPVTLVRWLPLLFVAYV